MSLRPRFAASLVVCGLVAALVTGCAGDAWDAPRTGPTSHGTASPGFIPAVEPSPEATILPARGSWAGIAPAHGYRVVLLTAGKDAPTRTLTAAVTDWAQQEHVDLRTVAADDDHIGGIVSAMKLRPDLIISVGNDLVDPLATVTPNHLDRQFLMVGAEVAEPTANVTAVDWTGAAFRGEGLGAPSAYDPASFTPARGRAAVRAGVAAVLSGLTGIVVWID